MSVPNTYVEYERTRCQLHHIIIYFIPLYTYKEMNINNRQKAMR